ncbi:MAG: hypothetical protein ACHQEM_06590 [Chitinophagales bacterium]
MDVLRSNFFILSLIVSFLLALVTSWYGEISIFLFIATVLAILDKLGKGLVLRELVVLHTIFICLVIPELGYSVYNYSNYMARIFMRYMLVPEDTYFNYALPAVCVFSLALCFPIRKKQAILDEGQSFKNLLAEVKEQLKVRTKTGVNIVAIGIVVFFIMDLLPQSFRFVATLFFFSSFAGILYIYYSQYFPSKKTMLILFSAFMVGFAIQSGIFTIVVYMGITMFSFLFLGKRYALWKKFLVFVVGVFFLFVIQNVKMTYRDITWRNENVQNKTNLFGDILVEKLQNFDRLIGEEGFFPVYMRTNQGYNISMVMNRIPAKQDFDNGDRLLTIVASAFVPRFLWPNKPEAGGKESMKYFAGVNIYGWSTNVGPIGEAYGSFGVVGGIFYMFILGLFVRWVYRRIFIIAQKLPLLILWIPVLFYQVTYSMETDSLQILNSLLKGAFFLWLIYKFLPGWFGAMKKLSKPQRLYRRGNVTA